MIEERSYSYRCVCGEGMHCHRIFAGVLLFCPRCDRPIITPQRGGESASEFDGNELALKTERLELRLARPSDWKTILPITSEKENFRYELASPDTRNALVNNLKQNRFPSGFRKRRHLQFVAFQKSDGETVGLIHLKLDKSHLAAYLGLMFHHPVQGIGYGTEAVKEIVWFAFKRLGIHRIASSCDSENEACIALLKKTGFVYEGTMKHASFHAERGWIDIPTFAQINPADPLGRTHRRNAG